jgi:hypothetical protein
MAKLEMKIILVFSNKKSRFSLIYWKIILYYFNFFLIIFLFFEISKKNVQNWSFVPTVTGCFTGCFFSLDIFYCLYLISFAPQLSTFALQRHFLFCLLIDFWLLYGA